MRMGRRHLARYLPTRGQLAPLLRHRPHQYQPYRVGSGTGGTALSVGCCVVKHVRLARGSVYHQGWPIMLDATANVPLVCKWKNHIRRLRVGRGEGRVVSLEGSDFHLIAEEVGCSVHLRSPLAAWRAVNSGDRLRFTSSTGSKSTNWRVPSTGSRPRNACSCGTHGSNANHSCRTEVDRRGKVQVVGWLGCNLVCFVVERVVGHRVGQGRLRCSNGSLERLRSSGHAATAGPIGSRLWWREALRARPSRREQASHHRRVESSAWFPIQGQGCPRQRCSRTMRGLGCASDRSGP